MTHACDDLLTGGSACVLEEGEKVSNQSALGILVLIHPLYTRHLSRISLS